MITTIHQPSSRLFHKFDKLILLGKGSLLYFGKASEAMVYFSAIGCSPLISMNPAEFLLDLANGNLNDVSVPSELEDRVQIGNSDRETGNGKPTPIVVHEVSKICISYSKNLKRPQAITWHEFNVFYVPFFFCLYESCFSYVNFSFSLNSI